MMPERIQHRRSKGWRMPPNTVSVKRPGFWGNWLCVGNPGRLWIKVCHPQNLTTTLMADLPEAVDQLRAVNAHRQWLETEAPMSANLGAAWLIPGFEKLSEEFQTIVERELQMKRRETLAYIPELRGRNLACFCALVDQHDNYVTCHADVLLSIANDIPLDEVIRENIRQAKGQAV